MKLLFRNWSNTHTASATLFGLWLASSPIQAQVSQNEAARFLGQASFGQTQAEINSLSASGSYDNWVSTQFSMPVNLQLPQMRALNTKMCEDQVGYDETSNNFGRHHIWWHDAINAPDQLRQRVAFALSQILVVSEAGNLDSSQFGLTDYYDVLLRNAFGNYRDLLKEVTLHPMMGEWLSHIRNRKENAEENVHPDENYAREILQLFSVGINLLNQDGSLQLDGQGKPIPIYGQDEIKQFARIFTGWFYDEIDYWYERGNTTKPMVSIVQGDGGTEAEAFHEYGAKTLLSGSSSSANIPAGQSPEQDIDAAIDNIFNHPNVGPFIGKQLIQRLVTSNPTPAYINRVSNAFNNDGSGNRGNMQAVIRAILLDPEARNTHQASQNFGKLREPLLRYTHILRAFGVVERDYEGPLYPPEDSCGQGDYTLLRISWWLPDIRSETGQGPLDAPSVFNFYLPNYAPQGPAGDADLVAPEFQIATEEKVVNSANLFNWTIQNSEEINNNDTRSTLDLEDELVWADDLPQMMDTLDLLLLNGEMSSQLHSIILNHLNGAPFFSGDEGRRAKLEDAIMLIVNSHEYMIQK